MWQLSVRGSGAQQIWTGCRSTEGVQWLHMVRRLWLGTIISKKLDRDQKVMPALLHRPAFRLHASQGQHLGASSGRR